mmetsp:Transcript_6161/g.8351  ORF Transcript_6161/g.8351 Transcript_6161/m.8351 type:complete len:80 (+) Transcript_6161:600-839(+)
MFWDRPESSSSLLDSLLVSPCGLTSGEWARRLEWLDGSLGADTDCVRPSCLLESKCVGGMARTWRAGLGKAEEEDVVEI